MAEIQSILKQYWGYSAFRPLQEDIIQSILDGHDTLALLPTGGGKSVCFQIPALAKEGICIVVTPLIALMKDQVEQLNRRGVSASAIYSGQKKKEIDIKLDNCVYGKIKFLYVSPERLKSSLFVERVKKMNVNLLAVDEAHCISQWGYDFRPAYLDIALIREVIGLEIPIIAVTATATPVVQKDIVSHLTFKEDHQHFQKSFARDNLSYVVRNVEDKEKKLLEVLKTIRGTAIIYARSRKKTKDLTAFLHKNNISADFYHAGLSHEERVQKQDRWIRNQTRIIVATNAFGMGIDKPDVRLVVHMDLPDTLEAYYQEAGRAGRDEKRAYGLIIYNQLDIELLQDRIKQEHPSSELLKKLYQGLANYFKLAVNSGEGQSFDFDIHSFSENFRFNQLEVFYGLKKLAEEGLLQLNESYHAPSQVYIIVDNTSLYKFQIANAAYDPLIKALLRISGGELFNGFVTINEFQISKSLHTSADKIKQALRKLNELEIIVYNEQKDKPQVIFTVPRKPIDKYLLDEKRLNQRESIAVEKLNAVINYTQHKERCRTQILLEYFGEINDEKCGICDICIERKRKEHIKHEHKYHDQVRHLLEEDKSTIDDLIDIINPTDKETFLEVIREMVDAGELAYDEKWKLELK